ncbi:MAG: tetrahydromethanopterin S-methyltransferase subunit A [Nitrososphaeraceae archaeon]
MLDSINIKNNINDLLGVCCYYLLPIKQEFYFGTSEYTGICTLSSLDLFQDIKKDQEIINKIAIVGRLLSENKGIDQIIKFTVNNKKLKYLLLCGKEVKGHLSGQTLIALKKNGVDNKKKIIFSLAPNPFLECKNHEIDYFRQHVNIINRIGLCDIDKIRDIIMDINLKFQR